MGFRRVRMCAFILLLAVAAAVARSAMAAGTDVALLKPPLVEDPRRAVIQNVRALAVIPHCHQTPPWHPSALSATRHP